VMRIELVVIYLRHFAPLAILLPTFLFGQDIAGDWQGALKFGYEGVLSETKNVFNRAQSPLLSEF
jgi:hypothetical protein